MQSKINGVNRNGRHEPGRLNSDLFHYSDIWTLWCLRSSTDQQIVQHTLQPNNKEIIKTLRSIFKEKPPVTSKFSIPRGINKKRIPMPWRHRVLRDGSVITYKKPCDSVYMHKWKLSQSILPLSREMGKLQELDGLVQERRNSIANALELCLSCTNPSNCANYSRFLMLWYGSISSLVYHAIILMSSLWRHRSLVAW